MMTARIARLCGRTVPLLLLAGLLLSLAAPALAAGFSDVADSAWYAEAVDFVSQKGLFQGTAPGVFSPTGTMTRAMFITILGRYAGADPASWNTGAYHTFSDVSADSYYAGYAAWGYENGVIQGDGSPDTFSPNKNVTREQVCVILDRFAAATGRSLDASGADSSFTDDGSISGWARDSVHAMCRAGVIHGRDTGAFDPAGYASRAEAAAIIQRFDQSAAGSQPSTDQPAAPDGGEEEALPEQPPETNDAEGNTPPELPPETNDAEENTPPELPPETNDAEGETPPEQLPETDGGEGDALPEQPSEPVGLLAANAGLVDRLSQGDRHCCLATCFSMAANLILGRNEYGAYSWAAANDSLSVPSGTAFLGSDGYTYSPAWGTGLSADELRAAIDSELSAGRPIIASVQGSSTASTHYVLMVGWTDSAHSDYLIVDPAGGGEGSLRDCAMAMAGQRGYSLGNRDGTFVCIRFA